MTRADYEIDERNCPSRPAAVRDARDQDYTWSEIVPLLAVSRHRATTADPLLGIHPRTARSELTIGHAVATDTHTGDQTVPESPRTPLSEVSPTAGWWRSRMITGPLTVRVRCSSRLRWPSGTWRARQPAAGEGDVAPEREACVQTGVWAEGRWSSGQDARMTSDDVSPFKLDVPGDALDDLRARLHATRWPEPATDPAQGVALEELQALCAYWADHYDWRRAEARLNSIGQYRTTIDGLGIHFLHARSTELGALPLVLTHGWPGSVIELLDVIRPLNYGFSDKPAAVGWGVERIARAWATLMARLGYDRYGAQGSDWGTSVTASLGRVDVEHIVGIHLMPPLAPPDPDSLDDLTDRERDAIEAMERSKAQESGYSTMHRTRPQTIGYALTDSPAGLAAWITEKLTSWTDPRSELSTDAILDNLMLYWLPRTAASSARLYWESLADVARWLEGPLEPHDYVEAPAGCTVFPYELQRPSKRWAERRFRDIRYWHEPDRGGHFAAMEQPALFVDEVTNFFAVVR
jgi:epoxide hydrolase